MPSKKSLAANQYYAHPRNLFWLFDRLDLLPLAKLEPGRGQEPLLRSFFKQSFADGGHDGGGGLCSGGGRCRGGGTGVYVMRYSDDSFRFIHHVFEIGRSGSRYYMLSSQQGLEDTYKEFEFRRAEFDERTKTLKLTNSAEFVELDSSDVTPAGA